MYGDDLRKAERESGRVLIDGEILWFANPVPLGEKEIRGILPISHLTEFEPFLEDLACGLLDVIAFYGELGTHAFNFSLFLDKEGCDHGFSAFCSIIARINPNQYSMSDSSFMERLHLEPVILTMPEELGRMYRERMGE